MDHPGGISEDWSAERNMESGSMIYEFPEKNKSLLLIELESISWYAGIESGFILPMAWELAWSVVK